MTGSDARSELARDAVPTCCTEEVMGIPVACELVRTGPSPLKCGALTIRVDSTP